MRILVLGSGGREHAIVRALKAEAKEHEIFAAPGNPGIAQLAELVELDMNNKEQVAQFAFTNNIELVVVGPEAPLTAGVVDETRARGIAIFGPEQAAAQLEGSKTFAKRIMSSANVPTGRAVRAGTLAEATAALEEYGAPYVVKADGLAAGKGVLVTSELEAATEHAKFWLNHGSVLVEEFLSGPEVSLFYLSDGHNLLPLSPAQDFKRVGDSDTGANTGGMGAYSPLPWLADRYGSEEEFVKTVTETIAQPTIRQLAAEDTPFIGLLYCGLILTESGIKVIEFNARFGDPETQAVLARLETPLSELLYAAATGGLESFDKVEFSNKSAVTVVLASEGYPEAPVLGAEITIPEALEAEENLQVLHAGTKSESGQLLSNGGRVLNVVALGDDLNSARNLVYSAIEKIEFPGSHYRSDIAQKAAEGLIK